MGSTLTRDLQFARTSADILKEELSAKSVTLDELVIQERELKSDCRFLAMRRKPRRGCWSPLRRRCPSETSLLQL
jgi:hypothetical protein